MINFYTATEKDIPLLQHLADEIWHQHYPGILSIEQIDFMLKMLYSTDRIKEELNHGVYWVIFKYDKRPAGFIACEMEENQICKLHKIYIYPHLHGKGIGRKAIEVAKEYARSHGADKLKLFVNRGNKASIEAYKRLGFITEKEIDQYLEKFLLDDYLMSMDL
ncbi:MAG: GNAT family N-acetyltransferase [Bacteroidota bacterium]|nr:GNAT family N-acetyltransferase [Bacteroidota bacterium]